MRQTNRQRYEAILEEIKGVRQDLRKFTEAVERLIHLALEAKRPRNITIRFLGETMPQTVKVNQKGIATATEYDAAGTSITPAATSLQWKVSDDTLASVDTNPDGTATVTALAEGSVTLTVTDESNNLTSSDVLTIEAAEPEQPPTTGPVSTEPGTPVAISITFGTFA